MQGFYTFAFKGGLGSEPSSVLQTNKCLENAVVTDFGDEHSDLNHSSLLV
jgi:hypothetical protein